MRTGVVVPAGSYFMQGNEACAAGAVAAGCRYFAFYPITPAGEIAERMAEYLPRLRGVYIQMEDEISSIGSVIGASWTGVKAMTATSGPGFTLMQENIGFAVMTETPCVIVDVQRAGPSTGIPPVPMQGDVVQARRGSHGEYEVVSLAPYSAQEMFDLTIEAFNLSEKYRTPVILLADEMVGHMREEVVVPATKDIEIVERKMPRTMEEAQRPFLDENVAPMPLFGMGYHVHVTGSGHDRFGMRNVTDPETIDTIVRTISAKINKHSSEIVKTSGENLDGAEVVLISYGSSARACRHVLREARKLGLKVGHLRLVTLWPFPSDVVRESTKHAHRVIVVENNLGQMVDQVERTVRDVPVSFLPPDVIGTLHHPSTIMKEIAK